MAALNGRLPQSMLAPIPGGQLRKDAALRWNAMVVHSRAKGTGTPQPNGADSTYRTYGGQVFWKNWWCNHGNCGNAATPGYSNHGWGVAVDTNDGYICDRYPQYGWHRKHSDAPWESWHRRWGGYGPTAGGSPNPPVTGHAPLLRQRKPMMHGPAVKRLQTYLLHKGYWNYQAPQRRRGQPMPRSGVFGETTAARVRWFQRSKGLKADGQVGPKTWAALRRRTKR